MDNNQNPTAPADPTQGGMPSDQPVMPVADQPAPVAPEAPVAEEPTEAPVAPEVPAEAPAQEGGDNSGTPVGGM